MTFFSEFQFRRPQMTGDVAYSYLVVVMLLCSVAFSVSVIVSSGVSFGVEQAACYVVYCIVLARLPGASRRFQYAWDLAVLSGGFSVMFRICCDKIHGNYAVFFLDTYMVMSTPKSVFIAILVFFTVLLFYLIFAASTIRAFISICDWANSISPSAHPEFFNSPLKPKPKYQPDDNRDLTRVFVWKKMMEWREEAMLENPGQPVNLMKLYARNPDRYQFYNFKEDPAVIAALESRWNRPSIDSIMVDFWKFVGYAATLYFLVQWKTDMAWFLSFVLGAPIAGYVIFALVAVATIMTTLFVLALLFSFYLYNLSEEGLFGRAAHNLTNPQRAWLGLSPKTCSYF